MRLFFNKRDKTAVLTCCHITEQNSDILYVSHDGEDGMWQFLCGKSHTPDQGRIVSLSEIITLDKSVKKILFMPCGYFAERSNKKAKWSIKKK